MSPPAARPVFASKPVGPHNARRYGLDVRQVFPGEVAGVVQVEDLWLETPLAADAHWTVAYRIVVQDGRAAVAELRVFPTEDVPGREPGQWSGEWLGRKATVPAGGLSTRALRGIRLGHDVHSLVQIADHLKRINPALLHPEHGWFGAAGLTDALSTQRPRPLTGRGRPALPAREYAELAAAYADAVACGSRSPVEDIARQRDVPVSRIRARIHTARRLGFLDPGRQGNAGGQLMPAARRLLETKGTKGTKGKGSRHGNKTPRTR